MMAIALAIASPAKAIPGETEAQIARRFGVAAGSQPITGHDPLGNEQRTYHFRNYTVVVTFENGESICEEFQKQTEKVSEKLLRRQEVDELLALYTSPSVTWKTDPNGRGWDSSDYRLRAKKGPEILKVYNPAYGAQLAAHAKKKAAEQRYGLPQPSPR